MDTPQDTQDTQDTQDSPAVPAATQRPLRHGRGPLLREDPDSDDDDDDRSDAGEHDRLLPRDPEAAHDYDQDGVPVKRSHHRRRRACATACCYLFGIAFLLVLLAAALLHLWVGHLLHEEAVRHANATPEDLARQGLHFHGPSSVRLVPATAPQDNTQDSLDDTPEVVVEVTAVVGFDVRKALDWDHKDLPKASWRHRAESRLLRWAVGRADSVDVSLRGFELFSLPADAPNTSVTAHAHAHSHSGSEPPLVTLADPLNFAVPLSYPSLRHPLPHLETLTWHLPLAIPSPRDLVAFGRDVYAQEHYRVEARIAQVEGHLRGAPGKEHGGKGLGRRIERWIMRKVTAVRAGQEHIVQVLEGPLPDLPTPPQDPASMVDLVSLSVFESPAPRIEDPSAETETETETESKKEKDTVVAFALSALLKNPLLDAIQHGKVPPVAWSMPFRLPIEIALPLPLAPTSAGADSSSEEEPGQIALARVSCAPFGFSEMDHEAEVLVTGYVVPAGNLTPSLPPSPPTRDPSQGPAHIAAMAEEQQAQAPLARALSRFVARYLSGRPNDVYLRYDTSGSGSKHHPFSAPPTIPSDPARDAALPPRFVADLVREQVFKVSVPGTNETPELFRDLRMEDMKVRLGGRGGGNDDGGGDDADLLASGRVVGEVVLPEMAAALAEGIDAKWIWPDVLVYDGDLPRGSADSTPEADADIRSSDQVVLAGGSDPDAVQYPPSPVPETAFARMRPSSFMRAETLHIPGNATHAARTFVSAQFVDAPLYLLPERGSVLRRFVGKIIFGGKAKASMKGLTSVRIALAGFGEVELVEIPIEASFMVGRGGVQNPPALAELVGLA
ncbi:hypothetical protein JCM8202_000103 [Rhodotorula sphaerocarpa]